jgi:phosphate starvation-inducible protein PhoH and related proteins
MTQTTTNQAGSSQAPQATARFTVPAKHPMVTVLGSGDSLLRVIEQAFPTADIHVRGNEISASGEAAEVDLIQRLFDEMMLVLRTGQPMTEDAVERSISMLRDQQNGSGAATETPAEVLTQNILSNRGRTIRPKTLNQKRYVDAIDKHTVVFGIGPAGTGKTYLAMAKAVQALQSKQVNRIILTRPAVEAGERLGFLPGTLYEKIDPYLRPLYDALHDMLDPDSIPRLMAAGTIEVAPLAYMRGRTLNDAFIILDEAQNTNPEQMKMFLTRLGFDSKIVITGDVTQVDLPGGTRSGLRQVREILDGVDDVHFSMLDSSDVVRHKLVSRIVDAYERYDVRNGTDAAAHVPAAGRGSGGKAGDRQGRGGGSANGTPDAHGSGHGDSGHSGSGHGGSGRGDSAHGGSGHSHGKH